MKNMVNRYMTHIKKLCCLSQGWYETATQIVVNKDTYAKIVINGFLESLVLG